MVNPYDIETRVALNTPEAQLDILAVQDTAARQIVAHTAVTIKELQHWLSKLWQTATTEAERSEIEATWEKIVAIHADVLMLDQARQVSVSAANKMGNFRIDAIAEHNDLLQALDALDTFNPHVDALIKQIRSNESAITDAEVRTEMIENIELNNDITYWQARNLLDAIIHDAIIHGDLDVIRHLMEAEDD